MQSKKYLILPAMPTPNGGLHLGHIGGPYLSADILSRYLRMCGHQVAMLSGTDSYESFVELQAANENRTIRKLCEENHALITQQLKAMQIDLDCFVDPLTIQYHDLFCEWHEKMLTLTQPYQQTINEKMLWDPQQQRYLTGCWLNGNCPYCKHDITGYFCDKCGAYFKPEEVITTLRDESIEVQNLHLRIPDTNHLMHRGLNNDCLERYRLFLNQQNNLMRLTTQTNWALTCKNLKLFSYGFLYPYYLFLGDLARPYINLTDNAFAECSEVTIIASFGIDNVVPVLASTLSMSACTNYKEIDYYLINYFYHLDHSKFSTSKRHAIWVDDLIHHVKANSDIVRLIIASINIRDTHNNFSSTAFIAEYNATIDWIHALILSPLKIIQESGTCTTDIYNKFSAAFSELNKTLQPENFRPHAGVTAIIDWLAVGRHLDPNHNDYFWWLKCLVILLCPYMPTLSHDLWNALGYQGQPQLANLAALPTAEISRELAVKLIYLSADDLKFCIQGALDAAS